MVRVKDDGPLSRSPAAPKSAETAISMAVPSEVAGTIGTVIDLGLAHLRGARAASSSNRGLAADKGGGSRAQGRSDPCA